ncbi:MAG: hypothetical protein II721_04405 [Bacilli bacterium]|nr:hypothetical protein [Bacilli bacterium]
MKKIVLLLSAALLASCGTPNNLSSSEKSTQNPDESSQIEESSSNKSLSSEDEKSDSEEASNSEEGESEESSSISEESMEESASEEASASSYEDVGSWTIDSSSIEPTEKNKYLYNYTFSVTSSLEKELSFYGDLIQRGTGQWEGHVQMKKYDDGESGVIESKFPMSGTLTLNVLLRTQYYEDKDHDFTGVPEVKSGEEDNLSVIEATSVVEEGGYRVYTYEIDGYFSLAPSTGYAIYFSSLSFE